MKSKRQLSLRAAQVKGGFAVEASQVRREALEAAQRQPHLARHYSEIAKADPSLFGAAAEWLPLRGRCFRSEPLSEKRTLGGTSKVDLREDVFVFCPFLNVTQLVRGRDPVPLGRFRAWIDVNNVNTSLLYAANRNLEVVLGDARTPRYQLYDAFGPPCPGGVDRHAIVAFECGDDHHIVKVHEDGICRYLLTVATPVACPPPYTFDEPIQRTQRDVDRFWGIIAYRRLQAILLTPRRT